MLTRDESQVPATAAQIQDLIRDYAIQRSINEEVLRDFIDTLLSESHTIARLSCNQFRTILDTLLNSDNADEFFRLISSWLHLSAEEIQRIRMCFPFVEDIPQSDITPNAVPQAQPYDDEQLFAINRANSPVTQVQIQNLIHDYATQMPTNTAISPPHTSPWHLVPRISQLGSPTLPPRPLSASPAPGILHQMVEFFLKSDDDESENESLTPIELHQALLSAIEDGNESRVMSLIFSGANVKHNQSEALRVAALSKVPNIHIMNNLLAAGADAKSNGYQLPLMVCERYATAEYIYPAYLKLAQILLINMGINGAQISPLFKQANRQQIDNQTVIREIEELIRNSLKPAQQLAFDIIYCNRLTAQIANESSMEKSLLRKANAKFEEIQLALKSEFDKYGKTSMEALTAIEYKIKSCILSKIIANARLKTDEDNTPLIEFIETNKLLLLARNQAVLEQFRALCKDNNDTAQVAWRAYDPFAPHVEWPNLLTQDVELRTRVAYYFIATPAINEDNFIAQLADIRRAHPHTLDSPSCEPGTRGRIGKMGEGHPTLELPPDRNEIIRNQMNTIIPQTFSEAIVGLPPNEQLELYKALTYLCTSTAMDIIYQQLPFSDEMVALRLAFVKRLPKMQDIENTINQALEKIEEPQLSKLELLIIRSEICDVGGKGRADTLNRRLALECKSKVESAETAQIVCRNPFLLVIAANAHPNIQEILLRRFEMTLRKHIEFELIYPVLREHFKQMPIEAVVGLAKILCEEITDNQNTEPDSKLRLVLKQFQARANDIVELSAQDIQSISEIITEHSTLCSLDTTKFARVMDCIEKVKINAHDKEMLAKFEHVSKVMTEYHALCSEEKPKKRLNK